MTDSPSQANTNDLAAKIARLVEERGWNQSDFARITNLNLQTIRQILVPTSDRRLRNATIGACARALGLTVSELRTLPLERLLVRMHEPRRRRPGPAPPLRGGHATRTARLAGAQP